MKIFLGKGEQFEANDISLGKIQLNEQSLGQVDLAESILPPPPPTMVLNIISPSDGFVDFSYILGCDNRLEYTENATLDWGDGSEVVEIVGNEYTTNKAKLQHTYSQFNKEYKVTIKGKIRWGGNMGSSYIPNNTRNAIISIELPTNNSPIQFITDYGFYYFDKLQSIPEGLFDNCTKVTSFSNCFNNCTSLQSIPDRLFDKCTLATNFSSCFVDCTSLQSIPNGLFDKCTKADNFGGCFGRCTQLQSIPDGLFDNNTLVTLFSSCFHDCTFLQSIPEGLFDKCIEVTDFNTCFYNCSSLQSIPDGLFDNCTKVTNFNTCFRGCTSLQSIPNGLFDNNTLVTDFSSCFFGCKPLQSIPNGLFDNNPLVTNFNSCFYNCSSLQSIPEGLFDNNTLVTNFNSCFNKCTQLQSIPNGLFDNCTKVTNFSSCFVSCSSVTSNLPTLWISHSSATHTSCFNYCNKAPNYAEAYAAGWATSPAVSLTIETIKDNTIVNLLQFLNPLEDNKEIEISWGDSVIETISIDNVEHNYVDNGEYIIDIEGDIKWVMPRLRMLNTDWRIVEVRIREDRNEE